MRRSNKASLLINQSTNDEIWKFRCMEYLNFVLDQIVNSENKFKYHPSHIQHLLRYNLSTINIQDIQKIKRMLQEGQKIKVQTQQTGEFINYDLIEKQKYYHNSTFYYLQQAPQQALIQQSCQTPYLLDEVQQLKQAYRRQRLQQENYKNLDIMYRNPEDQRLLLEMLQSQQNEKQIGQLEMQDPQFNSKVGTNLENNQKNKLQSNTNQHKQININFEQKDKQHFNKNLIDQSMKLQDKQRLKSAQKSQIKQNPNKYPQISLDKSLQSNKQFVQIQSKDKKKQKKIKTKNSTQYNKKTQSIINISVNKDHQHIKTLQSNENNQPVDSHDHINQSGKKQALVKVIQNNDKDSKKLENNQKQLKQKTQKRKYVRKNPVQSKQQKSNEKIKSTRQNIEIEKKINSTNPLSQKPNEEQERQMPQKQMQNPFNQNIVEILEHQPGSQKKQQNQANTQQKLKKKKPIKKQRKQGQQIKTKSNDNSHKKSLSKKQSSSKIAQIQLPYPLADFQKQAILLEQTLTQLKKKLINQKNVQQGNALNIFHMMNYQITSNKDMKELRNEFQSLLLNRRIELQSQSQITKQQEKQIVGPKNDEYQNNSSYKQSSIDSAQKKLEVPPNISPQSLQKSKQKIHQSKQKQRIHSLNKQKKMKNKQLKIQGLKKQNNKSSSQEYQPVQDQISVSQSQLRANYQSQKQQSRNIGQKSRKSKKIHKIKVQKQQNMNQKSIQSINQTNQQKALSQLQKIDQTWKQKQNLNSKQSINNSVLSKQNDTLQQKQKRKRLTIQQKQKIRLQKQRLKQLRIKEKQQRNKIKQLQKGDKQQKKVKKIKGESKSKINVSNEKIGSETINQIGKQKIGQQSIKNDKISNNSLLNLSQKSQEKLGNDNKIIQQALFKQQKQRINKLQLGEQLFSSHVINEKMKKFHSLVNTIGKSNSSASSKAAQYAQIKNPLELSIGLNSTNQEIKTRQISQGKSINQMIFSQIKVSQHRKEQFDRFLQQSQNNQSSLSFVEIQKKDDKLNFPLNNNIKVGDSKISPIKKQNKSLKRDFSEIGDLNNKNLDCVNQGALQFSQLSGQKPKKKIKTTKEQSIAYQVPEYLKQAQNIQKSEIKDYPIASQNQLQELKLSIKISQISESELEQEPSNN